MFGQGKKKRGPIIEVTKLSSLIAADVEIHGDISFSHGIRIDGCVKGNVVSRDVEAPGRALLVLSDKGRIEGSVRCGDAVINGTVVGDLDVEHFLELQSSAHVSGTLRYQHLQLDVGAVVSGQLVKADAPGAASDNVVELAVDQKVAGAERR
jgi:cytoskeletal protein CcmA (bactofilin family)